MQVRRQWNIFKAQKLKTNVQTCEPTIYFQQYYL